MSRYTQLPTSLINLQANPSVTQAHTTHSTQLKHPLTAVFSKKQGLSLCFSWSLALVLPTQNQHKWDQNSMSPGEGPARELVPHTCTHSPTCLLTRVQGETKANQNKSGQTHRRCVSAR